MNIPIEFKHGLNYVVYKGTDTPVPENAILYNNGTSMGTLKELKIFTDYGNNIIKNSAGDLGTPTELNKGKLTASTPNNTIPQGGKRKSRRNTKRKKSRKGKSRKNLRKSNRRR